MRKCGVRGSSRTGVHFRTVKQSGMAQGRIESVDCLKHKRRHGWNPIDAVGKIGSGGRDRTYDQLINSYGGFDI